MTDRPDGPELALTYVFDAYCGWCFGFSPAFTEFVRNHRDEIVLEVISGGLFTGAQVQPMSAMPYIGPANARIATLTGARFGAGYDALAEADDFAMNSLDAARGFAALRSQAPDRALEIASALQVAFYRNGLSLSEPGTYRAIAAELGLDGELAVSAYGEAATTAVAEDDFRRARSLGVSSFPTVLVHLPGGRLGHLGGPTSTAAQLGTALADFQQLATLSSKEQNNV